MALHVEVRTPTDPPVELDPGAIFANVRVVRDHGVGDALPLDKLASLCLIAGIIGQQRPDEDQMSDLEKIEYALRQAAARLEGISKPQAEAVLGLTTATRGQLIAARRTAAAELSEKHGRKTFKSHYETPLLLMLVNKLCVLVDERYLKDWESRVRAAANGDEIEAPPLPRLLASSAAHTPVDTPIQVAPHDGGHRWDLPGSRISLEIAAIYHSLEGIAAKMLYPLVDEHPYQSNFDWAVETVTRVFVSLVIIVFLVGGWVTVTWLATTF